ncbi:MAG: ECF-type sigma factor [Pyrinomonadaceae bacterium]
MANEFQMNADSLLGGETTVLLKQWSDGDESAFEKLKKRVDAELRRLAANYLRNAKPGNILQPTLIVHDAYLRLLQLNKDAGERKMIPWRNRRHFIGVVANTMRHILIDYIRKGQSIKGDGGIQITLGESVAITEPAFVEIIAVHEVLDELRAFDPLLADVVELYYFCGFSFKEIAEIHDISESSARRYFETAKDWIYQKLKSSDS